ncbi:hypothetical protein [Stenotrophomonas sp. CC120222-04]|uniref:hypothetical protein n=1 Tax=Stenotrophomonas sp. CC120222-04 TaxID=1378088 RepID=UPI000B6E4D1E|nr:hypothetical protein [Stenotrophomonas sp. CC120222-04]SNT83720.1 hypothetical protein SAMN02744786_3568 [Stenotrophomonas sp. CC120222-04]
MGIFGVDVADLEKLRASIDQRITALEQKFESTISERISALDARIVQSASDSALQAEAALNAALMKKSELDDLAGKMHGASDQIEQARATLMRSMEEVASLKDSFLSEAGSLSNQANESLRLHQAVAEADASTQTSVAAINSRLSEAQALLEQASEIPEEVQALGKLSVDAKAQNDNIKSLLTHSLKRKSEFDELHKEVFGHEIVDDDGNSERVDGLKDQLERSYEGLSSRVSTLEDEVNNAIDQVESNQTRLRDSQNSEFNTLIESGKTSLKDVSDQLQNLMPGALAAGLSAAYESKKDEEAKFLSSHERSFRHAVYGLVAISIIPFSVNSYLLMTGMDLAGVLKDTPRLVVSILPLYFPVLWLAYSANKRLNLSKRLIEEYTHKAVLGKTFSGLSNQIEGLSDDSSVKVELRTRLLFNVLQVSAENPGKLITDYSKADHPLMDALEKSARLSESIESLSKIPGLGAIAKALSEKRDALVREQEDKIQTGLAANEELASKDPEKTG